MYRLILAASLLLPIAAHAQAVPPQPPHTTDMTVVLLDLHGKPFPDPQFATKEDPQCEKCAHLTLGSAVATALCTDRRDEPALGAVEKAKRCALGLRLMTETKAALTAKEVADIEHVMSLWGGAVDAYALPLLDPNLDLSKP
jgi:hypothetical protein